MWRQFYKCTKSGMSDLTNLFYKQIHDSCHTYVPGIHQTELADLNVIEISHDDRDKCGPLNHNKNDYDQAVDINNIATCFVLPLPE